MEKFSYSVNEHDNTISFWVGNRIVAVLSDIPKTEERCCELMWEVLDQAGLLPEENKED